jgi:hypothetical protein
MSAASAQHWDSSYASGDSTRSWYQRRATTSIRMLQAAGIGPRDNLVDVGGGASVLIDDLLDIGWTDLTVLDVSQTGLQLARDRLGAAADRVHWLIHDLRSWRPDRTYAAWHDRAVLHFFTTAQDRQRYRSVLESATTAGSAAIFGVFSPDGPPSCSGLPVQRYGVEDLARFLGPRWILLASERESHYTPAGNTQDFTWAAFRRTP